MSLQRPAPECNVTLSHLVTVDPSTRTEQAAQLVRVFAPVPPYVKNPAVQTLQLSAPSLLYLLSSPQGEHTLDCAAA